ncbi:DMT family transporter [uncultured Cohaesibacter sp.]|uniref:DMT family transporter n=1 Tax=uncultured Cohaesibacter sp. TaxID=1002546 RepID=UPI0029C77040|nr:DMT family transporter [uncultured Cohaesibacter sp.]
MTRDTNQQSGATVAIQQTMGLTEWLLLIILSVLWGGSFFFVGLAVRELSTLTIVLVRVGLAALALWVFIALGQRALPRRPTIWLAFFAMGLLNNVIPFGLIVWGQHSIGAGLASILNATTPIFTVLVAGIALGDERLSGRKIVGIILGFVGVVMMIGFEALSGLGRELVAQIAILGAALSYACAGVFGRRFKAYGVDPVITAAGQVTASSLILAPLTLWLETPFSQAMPSMTTCLALLALALFSTALAYILYFHILAKAGATNVLLVTLLTPVSAILLGALILGDRLTVVHLSGMALIALGLGAIDGRLLRLLRR